MGTTDSWTEPTSPVQLTVEELEFLLEVLLNLATSTKELFEQLPKSTSKHFAKTTPYMEDLSERSNCTQLLEALNEDLKRKLRGHSNMRTFMDAVLPLVEDSSLEQFEDLRNRTN